MLYNEVGASGLKVSALGFGCGPIMGRANERDSTLALNAAYDHGITLYDTARSYGYGESEAVLGKFLKGKRDNVIVSTKFGILPATATWKNRLKPLARAVASAVPAVRSLLKTRVASQFQNGQFSVSILRSSLEQSLAKLQTDYVDILFLHVPEAHVLSDEKLMAELQSLRTSGIVREIGISPENPRVVETLFSKPQLPVSVVQYACNLSDLRLTQWAAERHSKELAFIANHPFSGGQASERLTNLIRALHKNPDIPAQFQKKLSRPQHELAAQITLGLIMQGTGVHSVIPAMIKPEHIRANVDALTHPIFSSEELARLRSTLSKNSQSPRPI